MKNSNYSGKDFLEYLNNLFPQIKEAAENMIKNVKNKIQEENFAPDENVESIFSTINDFIQEQFENIRSKLPEKFEQINEGIKQFGGINNVIKYCWVLEERKTNLFTFEQLLEWSKKNLDSTKHSAVCLYVIKKANPKEFHVCFLDKNNQPLLKGTDKHLIVYADDIDNDLADLLGTKDMLLLK